MRHDAKIHEFDVGGPVTVTIEKVTNLGIYGHALYGLVHWLAERDDITRWPDISTCLYIEVHSLPSFSIDWRNACPWAQPPPNVIFIQPHGFLEPAYRPININILEVTTGEVFNIYLAVQARNAEARFSHTIVVGLTALRQLPPADALHGSRHPWQAARHVRC